MFFLDLEALAAAAISIDFLGEGMGKSEFDGGERGSGSGVRGSPSGGRVQPSTENPTQP